MILVVDTETTGLNHDKCEIISIGAQLIKKSLSGWELTCDQFYQAGNVSEDARVELTALDVNGFSQDELYEQGRTNLEMYRNFLDWCTRINCFCLAGVNIGNFDSQFLKILHSKATNTRWPFGYRYLDIGSLYFGAENKENIYDCNLERMANRYKIKNPNLHHALHDAVTEAKVLCEILNKMKG